MILYIIAKHTQPCVNSTYIIQKQVYLIYAGCVCSVHNDLTVYVVCTLLGVYVDVNTTETSVSAHGLRSVNSQVPRSVAGLGV